MRRSTFHLGVQGSVGLPGQPARRLQGARHRHDSTPLVLGQSGAAARSRTVTQTIQSVGVEPMQPFTHGLRMTSDLDGYGRGRSAFPTGDHDSRPPNPVTGRVSGTRQFPDCPFFRGIDR